MREPGRALAAILLLLTVGCSQQPGDLAITDVTVIDPASGRVEAGQIYGATAAHGVTHFCGAPIVLNMLVNAGAGAEGALGHTVDVMTAASPPPPVAYSGSLK